jgi:hypothetical protein
MKVESLKNIGQMRHHIRQSIIKEDRLDQLTPFLLGKLSRFDKWTLADTCIENDAVKCYSKLKIKYHPAVLYNLVPPKICLSLKDDKEVFTRLIAEQMHNPGLVQYFCSVPISWYSFDHLLDFEMSKNIVAKYLFNRMTVETITTEQIKRLFAHGLDLSVKACRFHGEPVVEEELIKRYSDKFPAVWKAMSFEQKRVTDPKRLSKEDWEEIVAFPYDVFILNGCASIFPCFMIMKRIYPNNVWLNKKGGMNYVAEAFSSWNALMWKKSNASL